MSRVDYMEVLCGVGWGMSRFDGLWYSLGGIAVAARDGFTLEKNGISVVLGEMRWASWRFRLEALHGFQVREGGSNNR
jgi:hypothetical protein